MDLNLLVSSLDKEEKDIFMKKTATDYYHYLEEQKEFLIAQKHLLQNEKLSDKEWRYMINKLFLVSCRALAEEGKITFADKIFFYISQLGMKVSKKNQFIYNECYKMVEFVHSLQWEKEINEDLLEKLDLVIDTYEESELDTLLKMHNEASIFRSNQDAFIEAYHEADPGYLSQKEKMYIHSFKMAYQKEKEFSKNK